MRSATTRLALAVVLELVGFHVAKVAVNFEWRAKVVGVFGIDIEKPTRCFGRDTSTGQEWLNWCHDDYIPSGWEYLAFYSALVLCVLASGAIAARGIPVRPALGAFSGALACVILFGVNSIAAAEFLSSVSGEIRAIVVSGFVVEFCVWLAGATVLGYIGGRLARPVA